MGWGEAMGMDPEARLRAGIDAHSADRRVVSDAATPEGSKLGEARRELEVVLGQREALRAAASLVVTSLDHLGISRTLPPGAREAWARLEAVVEATPTDKAMVPMGEVGPDGWRVIPR